MAGAILLHPRTGVSGVCYYIYFIGGDKVKKWKKITVSVLTAAVFILAIVHVYNRLEEIWTLELSDISDTFKMEDAEMGDILESDGYLTIKSPEKEEIRCAKCGNVIDYNTGISIYNIEGVEDTYYCQDCFIKALIWLMENYDEEKK